MLNKIHLLTLVFISLMFFAATDEVSAKDLKFTHTQSPTGFIKGHSWGFSGRKGQYLGDVPAESMKKMSDTGANWVCICFAAEMEKPNEPQIFWADSDPCMVTDDEILRAISLARQNNLKITLKPMVEVRDGTWRAWIKFKTAEGKDDIQSWDKWWSDYKKFLLHYARIAEQTKCEMFSLGCEMGSTEQFEDRWRNLIAEIRKIYSGAITYDTNHDEEDRLKWWDAVDIISVSAYYPIGTGKIALATEDPNKAPPSGNSVEVLKRRWKPIKQKLRRISEKFDRPIFFIELGVCSARGCSSAPWTHPDPNLIYDGDEQSRYYQATIETFWDEPWFIGFAWWDWPSNLYSLEQAKSDIGFCIYGKPAEQVVRQWYAKPR
ncbi:MAG: hypothetical protein WAK60_09960 [Sedimentisphaerales bacterium]